MDEKDVILAVSCSEKPCRRPKWLLLCFVLFDLLFAAGIVFWFVLPIWRSHNDLAGPPLLKADGKELKATVISPSMEAKITPGKNVLWCSTFQLVWNESCCYAGGDIHLKDEPPIVPALNKKLGDAKDVDAASCLVMSGLVEKGIVGKIRKEWDRKFQGQADPDLLDRIEKGLPSDGWLGYAYLFRESEAAVACKAGESPRPRHLIFDKPFLILLERRGAAQPYFALWVDNPELLVPF